jgi:hypothetical protein
VSSTIIRVELLREFSYFDIPRRIHMKTDFATNWIELIESGVVPPDWVNELGIKWWRDETIQEEHLNVTHKGVDLKNLQSWIIQHPNGMLERVLTNATSVIYSTQSLEALFVYMDVLRYLKKSEGED